MRTFAQEPVWSPDVANIVYTHCASCHHEGGIAPFALTNYAEASENAWAMAEQVAQRHMPPWPADPEYRHFKDENVLTQGELEAVVNWVLQGMPYGDPDQEPVAPQFPESGSLLDTIDLVVAIEPYTLQYNSDEYRWFTVPTDFPDTVYVNAIEVFPGLEEIVHHADISFDITGESADLDEEDPLPGFNGSTGSPVYSYYMNAWQPGGNIARYPPNWGIAVPPGADFVIEIHYGPGAQGQVDSTVMNLEFVTGTGIRPVRVGWLLGGGSMTDGPLFIPANTVRTFHQEYTVPSDRSFVSICPHMHHVGVAYTVWYEYAGDSIPLISIPHWDFHWQKYYTFQQVQVIPAGAVIKSIGVYDNTPLNEHNPNDPPQNIGWGSTTDDEMFLCYFIWASYQQGDEDIVLDSTLFAAIEDPAPPAVDWNIHPVLADDEIFVHAQNWGNGPVMLRVLDAAGRPVGTDLRLALPAYGTRVDISYLPSGLYTVQLLTATGASSRKVVKR
jgi:hypothetical protein